MDTTAVNAAIRAGYFRTQEVLSVTYFRFQFPFFVCFYSMADQASNVNCRISNYRSLHSKLALRRNFSTYSQSERTMYQSTPEIMLKRTCIIGALDHKGAEFIGNTRTNSLNHKQTNVHKSYLSQQSSAFNCTFSTNRLFQIGIRHLGGGAVDTTIQ